MWKILEHLCFSVSSDELKRLETAWDGRDLITEEEFFDDVLCHPGIPRATRTGIFVKFCQGSSKLSFQYFVIGIALLTKADKDTRLEFLRNEYELKRWVEQPPQLTSRHSEIHYNFYQVLAGVTHLDEQEVEELEKVFGSINDTKLCKLTRNGFGTLIGGAIANNFIDGLFRAFDENDDGLVDFKELVCGLSASCRGPHTARLNFIAQVFDSDSDGYLSKEDIHSLYAHLNLSKEMQTINTDELGRASLTDFVCWANETKCVDGLLEIIVQLGHICLGLHPSSAEVELTVVSGFKQRVQLDAFKEWNIVSSEWWRQWVHALMSNSKVPPINNASIITVKQKNDWSNKVPSLSNEGAPLAQNLVLNKDFEAVAPCLWKALLRWHGSAAREGISLHRRILPAKIVNPGAINPNESVIELYPLTLLILRHGTASGGWLHSAFEWNKESSLRRLPWCIVSESRICTVAELLELLAQQLHINDVESARLWTVEVDGSASKRLLDNDSLTLYDLKIQQSAQLLLELRNADMSWPEEVSCLENSSIDGCSGDNSDTSHILGITGLYNMGNTCYMNSALQCLSNTRPLTNYFIEGRHKDDMKRLKSKGIVALEYANIVKELWSGKKRNIAPIKLRDAIRCAGPVFAERSQHDCQEFLSILLDLLHEDLNQIENKPFIELNDSDGRPDSVVANEAWEAHLKRDKSIIVDLFTGQLRSTLTCLNCSSVSCRFDAFTCLQLPIPIDHLLLISVVVVKRDGQIPVRYAFRLSYDTTIDIFKKELARSSRLYRNSFQILCLNRAGQMMGVSELVTDDNSSISVYPSDALLYAFELPAEEDQSDTERFIAAPTVIAAHRKMQYNDSYLLGATRGCTARIFGVPLILRFTPGKTTGSKLYEEVWLHVSRFLKNGSSGKQQQRTRGANRAIDAAEDIRNGYPFDLCCVKLSFEWCSRCEWPAFCRGCVIPNNDRIIDDNLSAVAIDWKPTALYLRYQHSVELLCRDDESVLQAWEIHYRPCSLISCLNDFMQAERLDDEILCKICRKKCPTTKSLAIWRLPKILIIHFKRFVCVKSERRWMKSCKVVDFPLENLDLREWLRDPDVKTSTKYNCFAIANHYGAMASGHYVAYAKNSDQWFSFNDSRCQAVRESQVDKKSAYLLFYERMD
uniref:ubiquitinyl hydrolase 1 n=1 Tax=Setaria digitata TaxID=48799 RepID=A0A915Q6R4_9BILA